MSTFKCALVLCVSIASLFPEAAALAQTRAPVPVPPQALTPTAHPAPSTGTLSRAGSFISTLTFAGLGFPDGVRFANLGGRREIFVPLPPGLAITPAELVLTLDDASAHDARRSLEILVNDRTASAIPLDGHAIGRKVRIPLNNRETQDEFLKISFLYSGAATQDRCIDVRSVGDSLTIRPESAIDIEVNLSGVSDVATTVALMPHDIAVVLPGRRLAAREMAAALTVARSFTASGRQVTFHYGYEALTDLAKRSDSRRWTRGIVVIGLLGEVSRYLDSPVATLAGPLPNFGTLTAVHISGIPALIVADITTAQASQLIGSPWLAATRGMAAASVGESPAQQLPSDRVSFIELGLAPGLTEVLERADIAFVIDTRKLPAGTQVSRLALDVLVAPDGAGERAVVSVFVNERFLGSKVAEIDQPTKFDLMLPDRLVGTIANVRTVIQRRSARGDCRFEPQGYPAQILGTSSVVLTPAPARAREFFDLIAFWANGIEVLIPASAADAPARVLGTIANALSALSPEAAAITVKLVEVGSVPTPTAPFLCVSDAPPSGVTPRARFDRGRVMVVDSSDRMVLDVGGFVSGAVAQIVMAGEYPGLWIKPLAADGKLPAPPRFRLERGDVAFLDNNGVAIAMSTERDTLAYPGHK